MRRELQRELTGAGGQTLDRARHDEPADLIAIEDGFFPCQLDGAVDAAGRDEAVLERCDDDTVGIADGDQRALVARYLRLFGEHQRDGLALARPQAERGRFKGTRLRRIVERHSALNPFVPGLVYDEDLVSRRLSGGEVPPYGTVGALDSEAIRHP